jgi:hypothetical protein
MPCSSDGVDRDPSPFVARNIEARPLPKIKDIISPSIEGSGASAEPTGELGGTSAVRIAPLRFSVENTCSNPNDYLPVELRSA